MNNDVASQASLDERYIIEVDGKPKSEYRVFLEALIAGLGLKEQFPDGKITVHGANEQLH